MFYSNLVKKAMNISFEAHKDDFDKNGYPYFFHPLIIAFNFDDEDTVCTALLHDVVEDHGDKYNFKYLSDLGFNNKVIEALKLLTKPKNIDYLSYVKRIKMNEIARKVKLSDLKHNSDLSRGIKPPKYELYLQAIEILTKEP